MLAIASGHLREAEVSAALDGGKLGRFVALDADADSLREVETNYASKGAETVHAFGPPPPGAQGQSWDFDFVYAAGLFDYLAGNVAQALTARMFAMTGPGGQMLVPNFAPQVRDRACMETFTDWHLSYRDEYHMAALAEGLDPEEIESYDVYSGPAGSVVYLVVKERKLMEEPWRSIGGPSALFACTPPGGEAS